MLIGVSQLSSDLSDYKIMALHLLFAHLFNLTISHLSSQFLTAVLASIGGHNCFTFESAKDINYTNEEETQKKMWTFELGLLGSISSIFRVATLHFWRKLVGVTNKWMRPMLAAFRMGEAAFIGSGWLECGRYR